MLVLAAMEAIRHTHGTRRSHPICSILRRTHRLLGRETRAIEAWQSKTVLEDTEPASPTADDPTLRPGKMLLDLLPGGSRWPRPGMSAWYPLSMKAPDRTGRRMGITPRAVAQRRWRAEGRLSKMVEDAA